jgi:hypothetical protein
MQNETVGSQVKKKKWYLRWWMWIIYIIVIIIILTSLGNSGSNHSSSVNTSSQTSVNTPVSTPAQSQAPIVVSASALSSAYKSNQVSADTKYKGNLVQVTGTIYNIGKDILNNPYVQLQNSEYDPMGVQCMFSQSDESTLANLSKGQTVTLQGTVSGEEIVDVIVDGCQIVK